MSDEDYLELWAERAALREYYGQFSRRQAEYLAAKDIERAFGTMPDCVRDVVRQGRDENQPR